MLLSDHFYDRSELEEFSRSMKEGHAHPVLPPEQEKEFMEKFNKLSDKSDGGAV
jgi:hypothetical protein